MRKKFSPPICHMTHCLSTSYVPIGCDKIVTLCLAHCPKYIFVNTKLCSNLINEKLFWKWRKGSCLPVNVENEKKVPVCLWLLQNNWESLYIFSSAANASVVRVKQDISYLGPGIHVATLYTVYMIFLNVLIRNRHVMKISVEHGNAYKFNLIF